MEQLHNAYVEFLNRTGVLPRTNEEEGFFRAGVVWGLRLVNSDYTQDVEKELTQLELFANGVSRNRSVAQNQEIVREFLEKRYGNQKANKTQNNRESRSKKGTKGKTKSKAKSSKRKQTTKSKKTTKKSRR